MDPKQETPAILELGEAGQPGTSIATTAFHAEYDKQRNLGKMIKWIDLASSRGANLIVFPEQCLQGYISFAPQGPMPAEEFRHHYEFAEPIPGPSTEELIGRAKERNIWIALGMTERNDRYAGGTGVLYNAMVLLGPNGVESIYRKVHLPGNELHVYVRGTSFEVVGTPIGRIGMCICHDKAFPETGRELMIKGADIIVHGTAWAKGETLKLYDETLPDYAGYMSDLFERHTAAANEVWFVSSNHCGVDAKTGADFFGHSRVIHPTGVVIADSGEQEAIVIVHGLDVRDEILRRRTEYYYSFNYARDRVPEAYESIAKNFHKPD